MHRLFTSHQPPASRHSRTTEDQRDETTPACRGPCGSSASSLAGRSRSGCAAVPRSIVDRQLPATRVRRCRSGDNSVACRSRRHRPVSSVCCVSATADFAPSGRCKAPRNNTTIIYAQQQLVKVTLKRRQEYRSMKTIVVPRNTRQQSTARQIVSRS